MHAFIDPFRRLIRLGCREPGNCRIAVDERGRSITITVAAGPADTRRLIGEQGAHYRALRSLCRLAGTATDTFFDLRRIQEIDGASDFAPFKLATCDEWSDRSRQIRRAIAQLLTQCIGGVEIVSVTDTPDGACASILVECITGRDNALAKYEQATRAILENVGVVQGRIIHAEILNLGAVPIGDADARGTASVLGRQQDSKFPSRC